MENWSINYLICDMLGGGASLKPEPRSEIWASDLGKPLFDTWHKMKGTPYTNPTDGRGMITFMLGKAIEQGVYNMLKDVGLAYESQERVKIELPNCLPVVGRPDLLLEVENWDVAISNASRLNKREYRIDGLVEVLKRYKAQYPEGLKKTPFEIKSINSMALRYNKAKGMAQAYPFHHLQLYTYMKAMGFDEGHLLYIAKDTGFMEEVVVKATEELDKKWVEEVTKISEAVKGNEPAPPPLKNGDKANWEVEYSNYKDLIKSKPVSEEIKTIIY